MIQKGVFFLHIHLVSISTMHKLSHWVSLSRVYNGCVKIKFSNMLSFNFFLLTFQFSLSLLHDKFKSSVWKYYKPNMSRCVVDFPLLLCEGNFHSAELKIEMSWHVWTIKNQSPKSIKEFITQCDPQNKNPFYVWGAYKKI